MSQEYIVAVPSNSESIPAQWLVDSSFPREHWRRWPSEKKPRPWGVEFFSALVCIQLQRQHMTSRRENENNNWSNLQRRSKKKASSIVSFVVSLDFNFYRRCVGHDPLVEKSIYAAPFFHTLNNFQEIFSATVQNVSNRRPQERCLSKQCSQTTFSDRWWSSKFREICEGVKRLGQAFDGVRSNGPGETKACCRKKKWLDKNGVFCPWFLRQVLHAAIAGERKCCVHLCWLVAWLDSQLLVAVRTA